MTSFAGRAAPCGPSHKRLVWGGWDRLEKDLQCNLHSPRDIALAACSPKVSVAVIGQPELIHRAEVNTVEDIACIGLDPNVSALAKVRVFEDGEVLVVILKTTDAGILAGSVAEGERSRVGPSCLVEISPRRFRAIGIVKRPRQS